MNKYLVLPSRKLSVRLVPYPTRPSTLQGGSVTPANDCNCDCTSDCACSTEEAGWLSQDRRIYFANREREYKKLMDPDIHLALVDAPAGYGKTDLLHKVVENLELEMHWKCIFVDLKFNSERGKTEAEIRKDLLIQLYSGTAEAPLPAGDPDQLIVEKLFELPQFALFFDSIERCDPAIVDCLQKNIVERVHQIHLDAGRKHKIIFAGRHIQRMDAGYNWSNYKKVELDPIKVGAVCTVLTTACARRNISIPPAKKRRMAENLTWLSGGHPGSMAALVREWESLTHPETQEFSTPTNPGGLSRIFLAYVHRYVEELRKDLGQDTFSVLQVISVFRMMDDTIIDELARLKLIQNYSQAWTRILALRLFVPRGFYFTDGVARQLVARELEVLCPDDYRKYNRVARLIWESSLQSLIESFRNAPAFSPSQAFIQEMLRNIVYQALGEGLEHGTLVEMICRNLIRILPYTKQDVGKLIDLYEKSIDVEEDFAEHESNWMDTLEISRKLDVTVAEIEIRLLEMISQPDPPKPPNPPSPSPTLPGPVSPDTRYDAFISYAWEDKEFVDQLAAELRKCGLSVWHDSSTLLVGDEMRRSFEYGLHHSDYGVVFLSLSYFQSRWAQMELDALINLEMSARPGVILPVWHNITLQQVQLHALFLANRLGIFTDRGPAHVAEQIAKKIKRE